MNTVLGISSFAAIVIIAYLIGFIWKTSDKLPDKWIPVICGISGCILGIVAYLVKIPEFPADDILTAAAVGIVSGFAATGVHQIYKQLSSSPSDSEASMVSTLDSIESAPPASDEHNTDSK